MVGDKSSLFATIGSISQSPAQDLDYKLEALRRQATTLQNGRNGKEGRHLIDDGSTRLRITHAKSSGYRRRDNGFLGRRFIKVPMLVRLSRHAALQYHRP